MKKSSFSTKHWVIIFSLIVIVIQLLLMHQIDRQLGQLHGLKNSMAQQTALVSDLQKQLNQLARNGVQMNASGEQPSSDENKSIPAFARAQAMVKLEQYSEGDWKMSAFGNNLKTITPIVSKDSYASQVQAYVLETLITRNRDTLEWEGLLAESWTANEDGTVISFKLRKDVVFSDGKSMTADDVKFSYDLVMNPKIDAAGLRSYYEQIKQVRTDGRHTVIFEYKEPYFKALSIAGGVEVLPKHVYGKYLDDPEALNQSKSMLVGTGPYMLDAANPWTPDKGGVTLLRNPRYWGPVTPSYDRIVWKVIENDSARLTAFRNGEIDSYSARPVEYKKLQQDTQINKISKNYSYMPMTVGYSYIGWNQRQGNANESNHFADKRVRQAMTHLIDRDKIINDIYLGHAEIAVSPFNPRSKQHLEKNAPRQYDLDKGMALLKEAGYEDRDGDGIVESEKGDPLSFELVYFQGSEDTKRMVLLIKDLLVKAKVELKPKPTEWPVMLEKLKNKDFQAIALGWSSGLETDIYQMFHSSQAKTNGDNFISYINPALDKLIEQARGTVDEEKRMPTWQQAESIMYEDQPYTFLFRKKSLAFVDRRIHNIKQDVFGLNLNQQPIETYVPKALQKH